MALLIENSIEIGAKTKKTAATPPELEDPETGAEAPENQPEGTPEPDNSERTQQNNE